MRVSWLPFTTSPGAWTDLPDPAPVTIAAGASNQFQIEWNVPGSIRVNGVESERVCVKATLLHFVDPRDPTHEINLFNNWAQSNFTTVGVAAGSPSQRISTGVTVTNALRTTATYFNRADHEGSHFRTYIGNAWIRLQPGEMRMVNLEYESLAGDPLYGAEFESDFEQSRMEGPERVAVTRSVVPPGSRCDIPTVASGVTLALKAGRLTIIDDLQREGDAVGGYVRGHKDAGVFAATTGNVAVFVWNAADPDNKSKWTTTLHANGRFAVMLPVVLLNNIKAGIDLSGETIYSGSAINSPSRSGVKSLR